MKNRILAALLALSLIAALFAACAKKPAPEETEGETAAMMNAQELYEQTVRKYEGHKHPVAVIVTDQNQVIAFELYEDVAPNTVANFVSLANSGFYDGVIFHRVIRNFMIQTGDPQGTGFGGPGYTIKGEFDVNGFQNPISHEAGVVSMARRSDSFDSAGSQFFICVADSTFLDGQYAAFGRVLEGQDAANAISLTETDSTDKPLTEQRMELVRVETFDIDVGEPQTLAE